MITVLHIKNVGIIDDVTINLNEGFNVLTGETGAGKTLIIDSLNIICGSRFSKEMIRKGESYSLVEICMYLPNLDIAEDGNVIVTREITESGKNLCKINGRLVTVSELKNFMKEHLDIHGQFDNQYIMDEANHIDYLDNFLENALKDLKEEYSEYFKEYIELQKKLKENYGDEKERERTVDLLKFEINEIEEANLNVDEEERLKENYEIIKNSEKINESLKFSSESISTTVIPNLDEVIRNVSKISSINEKYNDIFNSISDAYYVLEDAGSLITNELSMLDFDEEDATNILKRMDKISSLKRKYGNSIEEILMYCEEAKNKLYNITCLKEITEEIEKRIKVVRDNMNSLALKMHEIRENGKKDLEEKINLNLKDLEMNSAMIKIETNMLHDNFNENGLDSVKFLICTNKNEDFKSLTRIASGGEISRIILAIKSVVSEKDKVESCVFDEIDTGISGSAATCVGEKISTISKNHQVICVTHLSQVAAYASSHYYIYKKDDEGRIKTCVKLLNDKEKAEEIARISSGKINETTIKFALELLNLSKVRLA